MKLSVMSYTLARGKRDQDVDMVRMCEFTVELGLDGIDVVTLYGRHPREVRRLLDDFGLKAVCHTFPGDLNHSCSKEQQPALDNIKRGIENAVAIGSDKVMVVTHGKDGMDRNESRKNFICGLQKAIPWAKAAGITMTVENFPGATSPFVLASDFNEAKREVPGLKLTYDNGNAFTGENPAESFRLCAADVVHAHFKDWEIVADGMLGLDGRRYKGALIG
ncbi:MAG: sugar phosphate isomerase/epimerase, partial [bacterium]